MPKKGKKGVDQRVKGNVKTASSGRMAELLGGDGGGVIGFDAVSGHVSGGWEDVKEGVEEEEEEEVPRGPGTEFQVVMKQLGKRDTTTKLKALQEFSSLCQKEPQDSVTSILTLWTLMYNKLSMDNDNRVREASHQALKSCAKTVKNALGPHLRSIIGCWVSGMCDPHGPAASAAQNAFASTFPLDKQREVFKFGLRAIFAHTADMILTETPDTFSDPKVVPSDERLRRYERAVMMAVYSLHLSLQQLSPEYLQENRDIWEPLLRERRVWKLARHQNPFIRAATFSLVSTVCRQLQELVQSNTKQFCSTVLGSLGESEPVVIGSLWEATLQVVSQSETWSEHVNVQKALLPGLWSLLAAGGYGSAKVVYPCLLPFLRELVKQVFPSDVNFALSFLDRLRSGLQADRVRSSRAECEVVMQTYTECFLHLLLHMDPTQSERDTFFKDLLSRVVDLMEFSVCHCPGVQCEVLYYAVACLIDGLLQVAGGKGTSLGPHIAHLQIQITERITQLLDLAPDSKVSFTRLGELFKSLHSPPKRTASEKKTVTFPDSDSKPCENDSSEHEPPKEQIAQFMWPAVCSICAKNIAEVCLSASESHSSLLLTLLQTYGGNKSLLKSVYGYLEANHPSVLPPQSKRSRGEDHQLLVLCVTLSKVMSSEGLLLDGLVTENVAESVMILLYSGLVDEDSAHMFLSELVKQCPPVLPLLLLKLNSTGRKEGVRPLLATCYNQLQTLTNSISDTSSMFLWRFLELLITKPYETVFAKIRIVDTVFEQVCQMLHSRFYQSDTQLSVSTVRRLLLLLSKADSSLVEKHVEDGDRVANLMGCLLHWCLHSIDETDSYSSLLSDVASCYTHLLLTLPSLSLYLQSLPSLLLEEPDNDESPPLHRCLQSAVAFYALHCTIMDSVAAFWDVYHAIVSTTSSVEDDFIPLAGMESFCHGRLLYSPLFVDLSPDCVITTLSHPLQLVIFPAVALCDPKLLEGELVRSMTDDDSTIELEPDMDALLSLFTSVDCISDVAAVLSDSEGEGGEGGGMTLAKNWRMLLLSLSLALASLQDCQMKSLSSLEMKVVAIFTSALERSLRVGIHQEWLKTLLLGVIDKAVTEGPLWCLVLCQLLTAVERVFGPDDLDAMNQVVDLLLVTPESCALHSALSGLTLCESYHDKVLALMEKRENDLCLLVCLHRLFPESKQLVAMVARELTEVASRQENSEITLFDSVTESGQDHTTLCVLELLDSLISSRQLPPDSWDFALCSLVTMTHLLTDNTEQLTVNQTVLFCQVMKLCCTMSQFLTSPSAPTQQATEWLEFFQPALQGCLLPYFMKTADHSLSQDPCLTYCHAYLCKATLTVCTEPLKDTALEDLVRGLFSEFYPQQLATFTLAKRMFSSLKIYLGTEMQNGDSSKLPTSLSSLHTLLGNALEKVDMDLVFLEDSLNCHNTTTYVFIWMLIIEAMTHCDPETRGAMSEWLKELSLLDHLLHGLFKFIGETTSLPGRKVVGLEVTLSPSLEQLAYQAYLAVAQQLPSLLRQWYLSVDRQTSTMVNKFTSRLVSPALQKAELKTISNSNSTIGNMEMHVYAGASEVSVVYKVDEFSIELFVCLPENYPLQPPTIREGKRARVDPAQWRKWMLQLNVFVANQNGSLLDGLLLWKSNLDKHFSGMEDCMICFSVIHGSNYSVPKMVCKTCKKKFHAACLYKWFNTSSKSTCPLCRNIF